jgi:hypothetical protein
VADAGAVTGSIPCLSLFAAGTIHGNFAGPNCSIGADLYRAQSGLASGTPNHKRSASDNRAVIESVPLGLK